jgi:pimeloyl-ACP methyl ester carboxylesterase
MELFSQDIIKILEFLEIEHAHLIGHSMGGAVLMQLASLKPDIINTLTIISSYSYPDQYVRINLKRLQQILMLEGYPAFFDACLQLANTTQFIQKNCELFHKIRDETAKTCSTNSLQNTINACLKINLT